METPETWELKDHSGKLSKATEDNIISTANMRLLRKKTPSHHIKVWGGVRKGPQDEFLLVRDLHLNLVLCAAAK